MSETASIFISVPSMPLQVATSSQVTLVVSGLLVEFVPLALNVGSIDLLDPILRFDFFHRYRNGLFSLCSCLDPSRQTLAVAERASADHWVGRSSALIARRSSIAR